MQAYIPEDLRQELDMVFGDPQHQPEVPATQHLLPPPPGRQDPSPQIDTATPLDGPQGSSGPCENVNIPSQAPVVPTQSPPFSSAALQEQVVRVTKRAVERINKITRQWIALKANEYRLQQFKDAGEIPKTMRVPLPCPKIQTLDYQFEASDEVSTAWQTAHQLMFEEFLSRHHEELLQKEKQLTDMLPTLDPADFEEFSKLILQARESTLETELPAAGPLLTMITASFRSQLEDAFIDYAYKVRSSMVAAFTLMKKRSFAVRQYLARNEAQEQVMGQADDDHAETSSAQQQIDVLTSQVQSLRLSLKDTRNQVKQLKDKRRGRKNDDGRMPKFDRHEPARDDLRSSDPPKGRKKSFGASRTKKNKDKGPDDIRVEGKTSRNVRTIASKGKTFPRKSNFRRPRKN